MPRFVLLRHDCPPEYKPSHWDFMLERDGALMTWSLATLPKAWADALGLESTSSNSVEAHRLPDHRLDFLQYEGPLTAARGAVHPCDGGDYRQAEETSASIQLELHGASLQGTVILIPLDGDTWRLDAEP